MPRFVQYAMALLILLSVGCGGEDGPEIASVSGQIKMDGKPLPHATVAFYPKVGGRPGYGKTDEEGNYTLVFSGGRQGAIPGKNIVRITSLRDPSEEADGTKIPGSPEIVPMRYNAQTELEFEVKANESNIADFTNLVSDGDLPPTQLEEGNT